MNSIGEAACRVSTKWIVTTLGWLMAAAARAPRMNRPARRSTAGQVARHYLERDDAEELLVMGAGITPMLP